jgi:uncharacterized protein (TIGR03437 family)
MQRVDLTSGTGMRPTRTAEAPVLGTETVSFTRTLAPLYSRTAIVALTTSGFTVFPWNYDAASAPPRIDRIVNAADFSQPVAPGGLISVMGSDLSPVSQSSRQVPLPTALGESCLTVNGVPVPVLFVSPRQINAQLPFSVDGSTTLVLRTPSGVSDNFNVTIQPAAPSIFRNGIAGPDSDIPTVIRSNNNQVVTVSNPIHHGDTLTIYATGLGRTTPSVETGVPAPADPLASALIPPVVTIGGVPVEVQYAGLVPGEVGIYQINVRVGGAVPSGFNIPLAISQGGVATLVSVRVVDYTKFQVRCGPARPHPQVASNNATHSNLCGSSPDCACAGPEIRVRNSRRRQHLSIEADFQLAWLGGCRFLAGVGGRIHSRT